MSKGEWQGRTRLLEPPPLLGAQQRRLRARLSAVAARAGLHRTRAGARVRVVRGAQHSIWQDLIAPEGARVQQQDAHDALPAALGDAVRIGLVDATALAAICECALATPEAQEECL